MPIKNIASPIPVIDILSLYGENKDAIKKVDNLISHAAEHVGFFYVSNHQVPQQVYDAAFTQD